MSTHRLIPRRLLCWLAGTVLAVTAGTFLAGCGTSDYYYDSGYPYYNDYYYDYCPPLYDGRRTFFVDHGHRHGHSERGEHRGGGRGHR